MDIKKQENVKILCRICNTENDRTWRCIGQPNDNDSRIIKLMLPFLFCERCYRRRFCMQSDDLHLCGIAVFVANEAILYPPLKRINSRNRKNSAMTSSKKHPSQYQLQPVKDPVILSSISSPNRVSLGSAPSVDRVSVNSPLNRSFTSSVNSASSIPFSSNSSDPKTKDSALPNSAAEGEDLLNLLDVGDLQNFELIRQNFCRKLRQSDEKDSEEDASQDESDDEEDDEATFKLEYHKGGLFQQWVNAFIVVDRHSVRKYPDERRSERKCKEILLYDATFSVATRSRHLVVAFDVVEQYEASVLRVYSVGRKHEGVARVCFVAGVAGG